MPDNGIRHVFGPILSRRLGLSLGVDMVPKKTCTYDCVYCEVGRTTCKTPEPGHFFDAGLIVDEVLTCLRHSSPDFVTFGGSGEPTLNLNLMEVATTLKKKGVGGLALLTNGSLLFLDHVREMALPFDVILPTFSAGTEETLERLHNPHPGLGIRTLKEGLLALKKDFKGKIWVEVMLVKGINDTQGEWKEIKEFLRLMGPDRVQVGTIERPPAMGVLPVEKEGLERAEVFLGPFAESVLPRWDGSGPGRVGLRYLLETLKRRPLRAEELLLVMGISDTTPKEMLSDIERQLGIQKISEGGVDFYVLKQGESNG